MNRIALWYRVQCHRLRLWIAGKVFWLVAPEFHERQKWIGNAIEDLNDAIKTLERESEDSLAADIGNLQNDINKLEDSVSNIENDVDDLRGDVRTLERAGE